MAVDDAILPLCDVKGCHQPQFGEALELTVPGTEMVIRIHPCPGHYRWLYDAGAKFV